MGFKTDVTRKPRQMSIFLHVYSLSMFTLFRRRVRIFATSSPRAVEARTEFVLANFFSLIWWFSFASKYLLDTVNYRPSVSLRNRTTLFIFWWCHKTVLLQIFEANSYFRIFWWNSLLVCFTVLGNLNLRPSLVCFLSIPILHFLTQYFYNSRD